MPAISSELTFYEKSVLKAKRIEKTLLYYHNRGKTKLSFILIPHSNEKIFELEASLYLLALITSMALLIGILTISYFFSFLFFREGKRQIFEKGYYQKVSFLYHESIAKELIKATNELEENLKELNKVTLGKFSKSTLFIPSIDLIEYITANQFENNDQMNSNQKVYKQVVDNFETVNNKFESLKQVFYKSMDYLETRESIVQSMPSGRPLGPGVGFISSTYGKREDPVIGGGEMHNGVDFASPNGTPIYATAPAIVGDAAFSENSLGNYVKLNHENGFYTIYAHCSEVVVKKGDKVKRGDLIAKVGSTGKSTGTHLHYEVHIGFDPPYNPQEFINLD